MPSPNLLLLLPSCCHLLSPSSSPIYCIPSILDILELIELLSSNLITFLLFGISCKITIGSSFFVNPPLPFLLPPPLNPLANSLPPYLLYILHILPLYLCFTYPSSTVLRRSTKHSPLLSFLARILFTSVLLITGRASLDLTDVAIIQGISRLNTWAYLGSWPGSEAPSAPSEFDLFPVSLCAEILQSRFSLICDFSSSFQAAWHADVVLSRLVLWARAYTATSVPGLNAIIELNCLTCDRDWFSNKCFAPGERAAKQIMSIKSPVHNHITHG